MADKVTQKTIASLPEGIHRIDAGLYIRARGEGRYFFFKYQSAGKRREIGIGAFPAFSLSRAKAVAVAMRQAVAEGRDPRGVLGQPVAVEDKDELTFDDVWPEAVDATEQVRQWKNEKHKWQWRRNIEMYASPVIGKKPISEITRDDLIAVLQPLWATKTDTASKLRGKLERVFAYAIFKGLYSGPNPAVYRGNLDMVLGAPSKVFQKKHREAMTLEETQEVCRVFWQRGAVSHLAIIFGILTALRAKEFCYARWEEIDWDEKIFSVPPERMKVRQEYPHRVPLSRQAIAVLERCRIANPEMQGYVFKGLVSCKLPEAERPINAQTPGVILNKFMDRHVTMHGCRSTFRDWCEETGQNWSAAEKALMHETGSKVVRAYQRSDLLDIRRELMQQWADAVLPDISD